MTKQTCTPDQFDTICEMMQQLTEILLAVGVVEVKISKKEREIFWDTENGGKVDGAELDRFSTVIDKHWFTLATGVEP